MSGTSPLARRTLPLPVLERGPATSSWRPRRRRLDPGDQPSLAARSTPIIEEAEANLRGLLGVPAAHRVLFLQGGATLQFSMVPMNLCAGRAARTWSPGRGDRGRWPRRGARATRSWRGTAPRTATADVPDLAALEVDPRRAVPPRRRRTRRSRAWSSRAGSSPRRGLRWSRRVVRLPVAADRRVERYGLLYAGAQKNAGPAGADDRDRARGPARADPRRPADDARLPDVCRAWLEVQHAAGVRDLRADARHAMAARRDRRARGDARAQPGEGRRCSTRRSTHRTASTAVTPPPDARSLMNVTFRLPTEELERRFVERAADAGPGGAEGAPSRRRDPRLDLQRDAARRRRGAAGLHGGVPGRGGMRPATRRDRGVARRRGRPRPSAGCR